MAQPLGSPVSAVPVYASLMNLAIRDGVAHTSTIQRTAGINNKMFLIRNTLDQSITVVASGAMDAAMAGAKQLASNVLGIGSVAETWRVDELTQPWPYVQYTITAGGVPTVGSVTVEFAAQ